MKREWVGSRTPSARFCLALAAIRPSAVIVHPFVERGQQRQVCTFWTRSRVRLGPAKRWLNGLNCRIGAAFPLWFMPLLAIFFPPIKSSHSERSPGSASPQGRLQARRPAFRCDQDKNYVPASSYDEEAWSRPGARVRIVIQRLAPPRILVPDAIGAAKRLVWGMEHHHATNPTNSPRHESI